MKLYNLFKFGLIGCVAFATDFCITGVLKDVLNIHPYLSNTCGFSVAVTVSFMLNKKWTFQNKSNQHFEQFRTFLGISIIGLALNTLFLFVFYDKLGVNFYLGKALAAVLVFFWNFFGNQFFTFRNIKYGNQPTTAVTREEGSEKPTI